MKKFISLFLAVIVFVLTACSSTSGDVGENKATQSTEEIKASLDSAYNTIVEANDTTDVLVSLLLEYWTYDGFDSFYNYQDVEDWYLVHPSSTNAFWRDAKKSFTYRETIESALSNAQTLLKNAVPNEETQQYYDSLKELYLQVNTYYNFVTEFPVGYSKLTYMSSVSDYRSNYEKQKSEVEFNK